MGFGGYTGHMTSGDAGSLFPIVFFYVQPYFRGDDASNLQTYLWNTIILVTETT